MGREKATRRIQKTANDRDRAVRRSTPAASHARETGAETRRMVRKRSRTRLWGLPVWEIARGQNLENGERHGHARAIIAIGDIADGVIAVGGVSRGIISIGGVAAGVFAVGGIPIGLVAALGGVAVAPLAMGGVALGIAAIGGAVAGIYDRDRSAIGAPSVWHKSCVRNSSRPDRSRPQKLRRAKEIVP